MKLLGYIKHLQNKYNISNTEILEELNNNNIKISKSALSHKFSGDRVIYEDEFKILINVLTASSAEIKNLKRLFKIYQIGDEKYEVMLCVKDYIESFSKEERFLTLEPVFSDIDDIRNISDEYTLTNTILFMLHKGWGKETIKIICQPDNENVNNVILGLCNNNINAKVEHIVCFNNDARSVNNIYNFKCVKTLSNIALKNPEYSVKYYYDDIEAHLNEFSLFPFMLICGEKAIIFSSDFTTGICLHDSESVKRLTLEFDKMSKKSSALFQPVNDNLEYMKVVNDIELNVKKNFYGIEYYPCVLLKGNVEIAEKHLKKTCPNREELIGLYTKRLKGFSNYKYIHLCNEEGIEEFIKSGFTNDLLEEFFDPLPIAERKLIIEQIIKDNINITYSFKKSEINIPKKLAILCDDNNNVIVGFKNTDIIGHRLIIKERSIYKSIMMFLEYLQKNKEN